MNIRAPDFVLEIGSGNNPHPRSDVLCDKAIDNDAERGGRIVADRPLVEADGECLPFRDSCFDYIICAQVLEHAENPERLIQELMRVGRRGYIETPSEIAERLYGWPFHRSVIQLVGGKLVIRKKNFVSPFGELFHVLAAKDPSFRRFHLTHNALFLVQFEWDGRIDYEIVADDAISADPTSISPETLSQRIRTPWRRRWAPLVKGLLPRSLAAWGKSALARGRPRPRRDLREIIVCPRCKGPVVWSDTRIVCERCAVEYLIVRGIPRLLA